MNPLETFLKVLDLEAEAIHQASARFSAIAGGPAHPVSAALTAISECLDRGGRVVVTGVGKSGKIAQKISATLSSTGTPSLYLHPTEGLHGDLGMITASDLVLALSHTGNTDELLRLLPAIRSLGVKVIGLGGNSASQLGQAADIWLDSAVEQEACPHNLAPTSSTTLALAMGDALAVALMQMRGFDARSFARNHPGGSLGRRLNLKVSDVLHGLSEVPTLPPEAPVDEVLDASSRRNLGAVLIVDTQNHLLGIITDGDLRRALKHREKFFALKARELMTAKPVCISPDALAFDALEKMENRPSQIKELPVVDSSNRVIGLVRIHDLLKFF